MNVPEEGSGTAPFMPWRDDVLLPEESVFSTLHKIAWFCGTTPNKYLRHCVDPRTKSNPAPPTPASPCQAPRWLACLRAAPNLPMVHGLSLAEYVTRLGALQECEIPREWLSRNLRVCNGCMALGMHLRLHQHRAIMRCPIHHDIVLRDHCTECGHALSGGPTCLDRYFACTRCGKPLGQQAFPRSYRPQWAARVRVAVHQFLHWQAASGLNAPFECGLEWFDSLPCGSQDELTAHHLMLSAASRLLEPPRYVARANLGGACSSQCKMHLSAPINRALGEGTSRLKAGLFVSKAEVHRDSNESSESVRWYVELDRMQIAARRVATMFIQHHGRQHTRCLDSPYRMFGEGLDDPDASDLLDCCPVAVGFWMWRLVVTNRLFLPLLERRCTFAQALPSNVDLLLYVMMRSLLQYCIHVAAKCAYQREGTARSAWTGPIRQMLAMGSWRPTYRCAETGYCCEFDGFAYFMRFDAAPEVFAQPCPGTKAYQDRLKARLSALQLAGKEVLAVDRAWLEAQYEQQVPFARMSRDGIFFRSIGSVGRQPSRGHCARERWLKRKLALPEAQ